MLSNDSVAIHYFEKALETDPNSQEAKDFIEAIRN